MNGRPLHTPTLSPMNTAPATGPSPAQPGRLDSTPEFPIVRGSGNVFTDLGFGPAEAANLQLRSRLAMEIERYVEAEGITQTDAAERLGVTQPRVSDLMRGKLGRFTVDALVNMLARVGRRVEVTIEAMPVRQAA